MPVSDDGALGAQALPLVGERRGARLQTVAGVTEPSVLVLDGDDEVLSATVLCRCLAGNLGGSSGPAPLGLVGQRLGEIGWPPALVDAIREASRPGSAAAAAPTILELERRDDQGRCRHIISVLALAGADVPAAGLPGTVLLVETDLSAFNQAPEGEPALANGPGDLFGVLAERLATLRDQLQEAEQLLDSGGADASVRADFRHRVDQLSDRQREIFSLLAAGWRVPAVAESLFLSTSTVRNQLSGMYRKLGVASQPELLELLRKLAWQDDVARRVG